ncbi:hypothetical protein FRC07_014828 [Ceratobasidium sp. 392]|nr:hypothetical protein FRC07_014828 [Ceratobasidium sp. 392]
MSSIVSSFLQKIGVLGQETQSTPIQDAGTPALCALIIGINQYADSHIPNLKGAVGDAKGFRDYLIGDLRVPESQIKTLFDDQATRANIINAFIALGTNAEIKKLDPIVIFYAGHGAKLEKPEGWEAGESHIQSLIPHDATHKNAEVDSVLPIPDRTIATLLNDIAETNKKGDNITVIFDCCHSASGTREAVTPGRYARYIDAKDLPALPASIDLDILPKKSEARHAVVAKGFAYQELRSHVLLAACGSQELAYETDGAGDFTAALLKTLKEYGADKTTYKGCIQRLPVLQKQNPHCEGFHKDRIFFNAQVAGANRKLIAMEATKTTCHLQAGIAQNISVGAVFSVFASDTANPAKDAPLGSMSVVKAEPTHSILTWADDTKIFELPNIAYGFQTHCGSDQSLKVHFTQKLQDKLPLDDAWYTAFTAGQTNIVIKPCGRGEADIIADLNDRHRAIFDIKHALINRHGIKELPHSVPVTTDDILTVLRAAALWIWHLNRTNSDSSLEQSIKLEFMRVVRDPRTRKLEAKQDDLNKSGVVDIVVNRDELYGMKIINNSDYALYPYLFYFDVDGQSIDKWNDQVVGSKNHTDAPLPKDSFLTVGYGAGGATPFAFEVAEDKKLELGMLKLYVTNLPGEFSSIEHPSPFTFDKDGKRASVPSTEVAKSLAMRGVWHTVTVALIQRQS